MIPDEIEAEQKLIDAMREFKVEMNIDFVNFLIRRLVNLRDEESAQLFNWISSHVQIICVFKKWSSYNKVTQSSLFSLSIWNKINDIKNRQLFWFVREQTQRSIIV